MTDTVLWTTFYVLIALVAVAVLMRAVVGPGRSSNGNGRRRQR